MPTPVNRMHGQFAVCTIAGTVPLNLFDWELTVETTTVDVTAHGDNWEQIVPTTSRWTLRARTYMVNNQAATLLSDGWQNDGQPPLLAVVAYSGSTLAAPVFSGTGFPIRGNVIVPNAMVEQELEIQGTGPVGQLG